MDRPFSEPLWSTPDYSPRGRSNKRKQPLPIGSTNRARAGVLESRSVAGGQITLMIDAQIVGPHRSNDAVPDGAIVKDHQVAVAPGVGVDPRGRDRRAHELIE